MGELKELKIAIKALTTNKDKKLIEALMLYIDTKFKILQELTMSDFDEEN